MRIWLVLMDAANTVDATIVLHFKKACLKISCNHSSMLELNIFYLSQNQISVCTVNSKISD